MAVLSASATPAMTLPILTLSTLIASTLCLRPRISCALCRTSLQFPYAIGLPALAKKERKVVLLQHRDPRSDCLEPRDAAAHRRQLTHGVLELRVRLRLVRKRRSEREDKLVAAESDCDFVLDEREDPVALVLADDGLDRRGQRAEVCFGDLGVVFKHIEAGRNGEKVKV